MGSDRQRQRLPREGMGVAWLAWIDADKEIAWRQGRFIGVADYPDM